MQLEEAMAIWLVYGDDLYADADVNEVRMRAWQEIRRHAERTMRTELRQWGTPFLTDAEFVVKTGKTG